MGVQRRIYELINSKLPSWSVATTRYAGYVHVLDQELRGKIRFGKRLGHPLPVWVSDTSTRLLTDVHPSSTTLDVLTNSWIVPGSRVRLAERYDIVVSDTSKVSDTVMRLHITSTLNASFTAGTEVSLFAVPLTVVGGYEAPSLKIALSSPYPIYRGDVVVISNFHEVEIVDTNEAISTTPGVYTYGITLQSSQNVSFTDGQRIWLRAYPAYESPVMLAPPGPFVYDRVSGVFYNDMDDIREVDTLTLRDDASDPVSQLWSGKNTPIYQASIPVDTFLFGKRLNGVVKWDATRQAVALSADEHGRADIRLELTPPWKSGQASSWVYTFESTGPAKVSVTYAPGPKHLVDINAANQYTLTVPMPSTAQEIQIRMFADDPNTQVFLRACSVNGVPVRTLSHTTVAHVSGPWSWGSTGALAKRALRLEDVTARADLNGSLSSGFVVV